MLYILHEHDSPEPVMTIEADTIESAWNQIHSVFPMRSDNFTLEEMMRGDIHG